MVKPRVLQLTGSRTDKFHEQLSLTYARDCSTALDNEVEFIYLHVSPSGEHFLISAIDRNSIASAESKPLDQIIRLIMETQPVVALPQMFCEAGMTTYRSLLDLLRIPLVGNTAFAMALTRDKAKTRAIVASGGVRVPDGFAIRSATIASRLDAIVNQVKSKIDFPLIVKPSSSDNSEGVALVLEHSELVDAIKSASEFSDQVLIEQFIAPGREVRCGVLEKEGSLHCLPLQEYFVDETQPIRHANDKLVAQDDGTIELTSRLRRTSFQVADDDPVNQQVFEQAIRAHRALGCRDYSLFDFRIDSEGKPWFLEAGLYCSFARSSVVATMAGYAGIGLNDLFQIFLSKYTADRLQPC